MSQPQSCCPGALQPSSRQQQLHRCRWALQPGCKDMHQLLRCSFCWQRDCWCIVIIRRATGELSSSLLHLSLRAAAAATVAAHSCLCAVRLTVSTTPTVVLAKLRLACGTGPAPRVLVYVIILVTESRMACLRTALLLDASNTPDQATLCCMAHMACCPSNAILSHTAVSQSCHLSSLWLD